MQALQLAYCLIMYYTLSRITTSLQLLFTSLYTPQRGLQYYNSTVIPVRIGAHAQPVVTFPGCMTPPPPPQITYIRTPLLPTYLPAPLSRPLPRSTCRYPSTQSSPLS